MFGGEGFSAKGENSMIYSIRLWSTLSLLLSPWSVHAYGPPSITVAQQDYACQVAASDGRVLLPRITRSLVESQKAPGARFLRSELLLGDRTGFETGNGNIDRLLSPVFGPAGYDQSSLSIELEKQDGGKELALEPLMAAQYRRTDAWQATSQDDLRLFARLTPTSDWRLDLEISFAVAGRSLVLTGSCTAL